LVPNSSVSCTNRDLLAICGTTVAVAQGLTAAQRVCATQNSLPSGSCMTVHW
jgi:hypothetical protein